MAENNRPIYKYQLGTVECAVWAKKASDGRNYFQFTFQKAYKSKDGNFLHTSSFNKSDLPLLATLCQRACLEGIAKQANEMAPAHTAQETVQQVAQAVGGPETLTNQGTDEDVPF